MNLIEWVMNNFIFVLGAIFALVSFLGKSKKQNEGQRPSQTGNHRETRHEEYDSRYDDVDEDDEEYEDDYDEEPAPYNKQPHPVYTAAQNESLEEKLRELELERMRMERARLNLEHAAQRKAAARMQSSEKQKRSDSDGFLNPEDIRKGIIWAEILGPPRAKQGFAKHRK
ncbi:hypothetical protein M3231_15975 [Neobacillus mesonae]|nr:hypothetical protein [Neobacillus mesonae]